MACVTESFVVENCSDTNGGAVDNVGNDVFNDGLYVIGDVNCVVVGV